MDKQLMRILALLALSLPLLAGNSCVTTEVGEVHDASKWTACGGTYPQTGDTAQILHAMTMTSSWAPGPSPVASNPFGGTYQTPAIEIRNTTVAPAGTGTLTVTNGTLALHGDVRMISLSLSRAAALSLDSTAGGTVALVFDSSLASAPAATSYRMYTDSSGYAHRILMTGTSGNHITVSSNTAGGSANGILWDMGTSYDTLHINLAYVDLVNIGTASEPVSEDSGTWSGPVAGQVDKRFSYVTALRCGMLFSGGSENSNKVSYVFDHVVTKETLAPYCLGVYSKLTRDPTAIWAVTNSYFDKGFSGSTTSFGGFTLNYVVFDGQNGAGAVIYAAASVDHVLIHVTGEINNFRLMGADSTYLYIYADTTGSGQTAGQNSQGVSIGPFASGPSTGSISHLFYEFGDGRNVEGTAFNIAAGSPADETLSYSLILPTAQNKTLPSGDINTGLNSKTQHYFHNLMLVGGWIAGSWYQGEQNNGTEGEVADLKSNLIVDLSPSARGNGVLTIPAHASTLVMNTFAPAGVDYNDNYQYLPVSRWVAGLNAGCNPCTNNGTPYDVPMTGTAPGTHDRNGADPQFMWSRLGQPVAPGIREWANLKHGKAYDTACGGVYTGCYTAASAFSVFADSAQAGALNTTIDELFATMGKWWSPTNAALKGAAHDGTDIGPLPWISFGNPMFPMIWSME